MANYVCCRDDRPSSAGSSIAIAVRTPIGHHRVVLPLRAYLEATAGDIHEALGGVFLVVPYKPP